MSFFANTPIGSIEIVTQNGRVVEFVMPGWQGSYRREEDDISLKRQQDIIELWIIFLVVQKKKLKSHGKI